VYDALPGNAPGARAETHAIQATVANHAVNGAAGEAEQVGHLIRPEESLFEHQFHD
jgi:hypothetical protein